MKRALSLVIVLMLLVPLASCKKAENTAAAPTAAPVATAAATPVPEGEFSGSFEPLVAEYIEAFYAERNIDRTFECYYAPSVDAVLESEVITLDELKARTLEGLQQTVALYETLLGGTDAVFASAGITASTACDAERLALWNTLYANAFVITACQEVTVAVTVTCGAKTESMDVAVACIQVDDFWYISPSDVE